MRAVDGISFEVDSGMLTTLVEFLRAEPTPTADDVRVAISGNLCRCTGYQHIVNAIQHAANKG